MRFAMTLVLVFLCGCGPPPEPQNQTAESLNRQQPTCGLLQAEPSEDESEPQPAAASPRFAGSGIATVESRSDGGIRVRYNIQDVRSLTDSRLVLVRDDKIVAHLAVVWACHDDEADTNVVMCHPLTQGEFEYLEGDQLFLDPTFPHGHGGSAGGGLAMPFGRSMFGPWDAGSGYAGR